MVMVKAKLLLREAEKETEKKQEDHARMVVFAWSSQVGEEGGCET